MSDEEVALQLTKIYTRDCEINSRKKLTDYYLDFLEDLKSYKSKTIKGKIEKLLYEYDNRHGYSEHDKNQLIENIEKVIKEE